MNLNRAGLQTKNICERQEIWKLTFWLYYSSTYRLKMPLALSWHRIHVHNRALDVHWWAFLSLPSGFTWASGLFLWTASWGKIVRINGAFTQCRGKADPAFTGAASVTCVSSARFVPRGTPNSTTGESTRRPTVLLCEWIKLISSANAAAVLRSAPLRAKWNMESFVDAISSGLDCYWSHKMGERRTASICM